MSFLAGFGSPQGYSSVAVGVRRSEGYLSDDNRDSFQLIWPLRHQVSVIGQFGCMVIGLRPSRTKDPCDLSNSLMYPHLRAGLMFRPWVRRFWGPLDR